MQPINLKSEIIFVLLFLHHQTVAVAQSVRASDCGSEGRGFETHQSPKAPPTRGAFLFTLPKNLHNRRFSLSMLIKVNIKLSRRERY